MQSNEKLIQNIWKRISGAAPTKAQISAITKKAEKGFKDAKGKLKLGTFISWWARQEAAKVKKSIIKKVKKIKK